MKPVLVFLRSHLYEIFVTALVLSLGVASRQLRHAEAAVEAAAIATPSPAMPSPASVSTPEPTLLWLRPVSGGILTPYATSALLWNADMDCWQTHAALDLSAAADEPVLAAADGTVTSVAQDPLLGLTVTIDHCDGFATVYASLASVSCARGDHLHAGESLGIAGNSADSEALLGCHLHFELLQDGLPIKPVFQ